MRIKLAFDIHYLVSIAERNRVIEYEYGIIPILAPRGIIILKTNFFDSSHLSTYQ